MRREPVLARVVPSTTVAGEQVRTYDTRTSSLPAADTVLRIWLALSILLLAVASVPRALAVHIPGAWHLSRVRGSLALAGAVMLSMVYVMFLLDFA